MTVINNNENTTHIHMSKKQKTETSAPAAEGQSVNAADDEKMPSNEMIGLILAATREPDLNIVEFGENLTDLKIAPEDEPISDSELPKRIKHHKHKKVRKEKEKDSAKPKSSNSDDKNNAGTSEKLTDS